MNGRIAVSWSCWVTGERVISNPLLPFPLAPARREGASAVIARPMMEITPSNSLHHCKDVATDHDRLGDRSADFFSEVDFVVEPHSILFPESGGSDRVGKFMEELVFLVRRPVDDAEAGRETAALGGGENGAQPIDQDHRERASIDDLQQSADRCNVCVRRNFLDHFLLFRRWNRLSLFPSTNRRLIGAELCGKLLLAQPRRATNLGDQRRPIVVRRFLCLGPRQFSKPAFAPTRPTGEDCRTYVSVRLFLAGPLLTRSGRSLNAIDSSEARWAGGWPNLPLLRR